MELREVTLKRATTTSLTAMMGGALMNKAKTNLTPITYSSLSTFYLGHVEGGREGGKRLREKGGRGGEGGGNEGEKWGKERRRIHKEKHTQ